jgi:hypothetical protein
LVDPEQIELCGSFVDEEQEDMMLRQDGRHCGQRGGGK